MIVRGIDRKPDDFRVAFIEFGFELRHVAKLCCANRRKILGVRKQHSPGIAYPVVKADLTLRRLRLEIRRGVVDPQSHCCLQSENQLPTREPAPILALWRGNPSALRGDC